MTPARLLTILGAAFAANASLVVLQTLTFHLLAWDSSAIPTATMTLRVAFLAADVSIFAALVAFARSHRGVRGLVLVAALLAGSSVLSGLMGLALRVGSSTSPAVRVTTAAMSGAEPVTSLAAALLAAMALAALAPRRGEALVAAVGVSTAVSLGARLFRLFDSSPRSIPAAWLSWSNEVLRSALIAAFALALARLLRRATAPVAAAATTPYRAAGEGAPRLPVIPAPDEVTAARLRSAASGLSLYRAGFFLRVGCAVVTFVMFAILILGRNGTDTELLILVLLPLTSLVTAAVIAVGLVKLLAAPRSLCTRGVVIAALLAIGVCALADGGTLLFAVASSFASMSYDVRRKLVEMIALEWPFALLAAGTSLLFVTSMVCRLGDGVGRPDIVASSRWVQGFAVAAAASSLGAVLGGIAMQGPMRSAGWGERSDAGMLVVFGLGAASIVFLILAVAFHGMAVSAARQAMLDHAAKAG